MNLNNLTILRSKAQDRELEMRKLRYFLQSSKFESMLAMCKVHEVDQIHKLVETGSYVELMSYFRSIVHREIESMNIKQLRARAAKLLIRGYWSLPKSTLILRILSVQANRTDDLPNGGPPDKAGPEASSKDS